MFMKPGPHKSPIGAASLENCAAEKIVFFANKLDVEKVEKKVDDNSARDNVNVHSILVEIQQGLKNFNKCEHKDNYSIDLGAIPLSPEEREYLFELLGHGEVDISLSSLGKSEIYETLYSGVWVIKHRDEQGQFNGMFVEIGDIPDIILSCEDDRTTAAMELHELMDNL